MDEIKIKLGKIEVSANEKGTHGVLKCRLGKKQLNEIAEAVYYPNYCYVFLIIKKK